MSKHSIRIGSDSRFSVSRSSSSASTRRWRFVSARNVSDGERELGVALGELLKPPLLAALGRAHLDPRAPQLREELLERGRRADAARHQDLRRDRSCARRSTRGRTAPAPRPRPRRLRSRGGRSSGRSSCRRAAGTPARRRDRCRPRSRSRRSSRSTRAPSTAARPAPRLPSAGCGSERPPRTARPPPPLASASRAACGSGGRCPERNSITPSMIAR